MKTVGVLGGIGPQATMDFEARFHQAVQRHSQIPSGNHGYPPLVVWYHRRPPVVVGEDMLPRFPIQPDPALLEGAAFLGRVADFLVITANGPHAIQPEIEAAAGKPVLSMIDVAFEAMARRGWRRVGVLGLGEPHVYTGPLSARDVPFETIDGDLRARLDAGILRLMAGRELADDAATALEAVDDLRGRGVDGVILGCTELPLLLGEAGEAADLLNPGALLAEEAALHALRD